MAPPIVTVERLTKCFGGTPALDDCNLVIDRGQIHAVIGPPGAGKTTLLRILVGLVKADSGYVSVASADPWNDAVDLHRRVAYLPATVDLWPTLTARETIDLLLSMRRTKAVRRDELMDRFGLDGSRKVRHCSPAERRSIALVAAFASDADLVVLDDPTTGLDPQAATLVGACTAQARARGATVIAACRGMADVEADRVTVLRAGRVLQQGTPAELAPLQRIRVRATTATPVRGLTESEHVSALSIEGTTVSCQASGPGLAAVLAAVTAAVPVALECRPVELSEILLEQFGQPSARVPEQRTSPFELPAEREFEPVPVVAGGATAGAEAEDFLDLTDAAVADTRDPDRIIDVTNHHGSDQGAGAAPAAGTTAPEPRRRTPAKRPPAKRTARPRPQSGERADASDDPQSGDDPAVALNPPVKRPRTRRSRAARPPADRDDGAAGR